MPRSLIPEPAGEGGTVFVRPHPVRAYRDKRGRLTVVARDGRAARLASCSAECLWSALAEEATRADLVACLATRFPAMAPPRLAHDVERFLHQLVEMRLLRVARPANR